MYQHTKLYHQHSEE